MLRKVVFLIWRELKSNLNDSSPSLLLCSVKQSSLDNFFKVSKINSVGNGHDEKQLVVDSQNGIKRKVPLDPEIQSSDTSVEIFISTSDQQLQKKSKVDRINQNSNDSTESVSENQTESFGKCKI
jgi:hypothetical protein